MFRQTAMPTAAVEPFFDQLAHALTRFRLRIRTPALPQGIQNISVNCHFRGEAFTQAILAADLSVYSIDFAARNGSVAGGTEFMMTGKGFSRNCDENKVAFSCIHGGHVPSNITEFVLCNETNLIARTPSMINHYTLDHGSYGMYVDFNFQRVFF